MKLSLFGVIIKKILSEIVTAIQLPCVIYLRTELRLNDSGYQLILIMRAGKTELFSLVLPVITSCRALGGHPGPNSDQ